MPKTLETFADEKYQECLGLSNRIKILGAERAEALAELAQLRQVPLLQLMDNLGIEPPSCG